MSITVAIKKRLIYGLTKTVNQIENFRKKLSKFNEKRNLKIRLKYGCNLELQNQLNEDCNHDQLQFTCSQKTANLLLIIGAEICVMKITFVYIFSWNYF